MNYVVSTEKSLKRWLKNRVTVTTATVVGFLLTGVIAFGTETDKIINAGETLDKGLIYDSGNPIVYVENNGKIEITESSKLQDNSAVRLQKEEAGKMKELINNGEIIVKNTDENIGFVNGVKLLGNARVTNNNLINVETEKSAYGVFASITDKYITDKPVIENNGTISTTAKLDSSAVYIKNKSNKEINIINTGILKAGGSNNTRVVDLVSGKIKFENSGTVAIVGDKGYYAIGGVLDCRNSLF